MTSKTSLALAAIEDEKQALRIRNLGFWTAIGAIEFCSLVGILCILSWSIVYSNGFSMKEDHFGATNLHAFFMFFGGIIIPVNTMLSYQIFYQLSEKKKRNIHIGLSICGLVFTIIGITFAYLFHKINGNKPTHLYSLHSWLGVMSSFMFLCHIIVAFPLFGLKAPGAFKPESYKVDYHVFIGSLAFGLSTITFITGIAEKMYLEFQTSDRSFSINLQNDFLIHHFLTLSTIVLTTVGAYLRVTTNHLKHLVKYTHEQSAVATAAKSISLHSRSKMSNVALVSPSGISDASDAS